MSRLFIYINEKPDYFKTPSRCGVQWNRRDQSVGRKITDCLPIFGSDLMDSCKGLETLGLVDIMFQLFFSVSSEAVNNTGGGII